MRIRLLRTPRFTLPRFAHTRFTVYAVRYGSATRRWLRRSICLYFRTSITCYRCYTTTPQPLLTTVLTTCVYAVRFGVCRFIVIHVWLPFVLPLLRLRWIRVIVRTTRAALRCVRFTAGCCHGCYMQFRVLVV